MNVSYVSNESKYYDNHKVHNINVILLLSAINKNNLALGLLKCAHKKLYYFHKVNIILFYTSCNKKRYLTANNHMLLEMSPHRIFKNSIKKLNGF